MRINLKHKIARSMLENNYIFVQMSSLVPSITKLSVTFVHTQGKPGNEASKCPSPQGCVFSGAYTLYVCPECNRVDHHSSRIVLQFPRAAPVDRTLAMKSSTLLPLVLSILPVSWMGQNAVMVYAAMSYRAMLWIAGVSLQCLSSVVKVWPFLWLLEV